MLASTASHPQPRPAPAVRESSRELDAYNAAFDELELDWHWDRAILEGLTAVGTEKDRICAYLRAHRPHLLTVYDADALAEQIAEVKFRLLAR
jgi:hypothetical protein